MFELVQGAMTEYHKLVSYKTNIFPTLLEAGKFKINVPSNPVFGEVLVPCSERALFLLYPHIGDGGFFY